jgi:hypothetical protein
MTNVERRRSFRQPCGYWAARATLCRQRSGVGRHFARSLSLAAAPFRIRLSGSATATKAIEATKGSPLDYETLARSGLVARVRAAWPWLAEHRPDLSRAICDADYAGDVGRLRSAMEEASRVYETRPQAKAVRVYSRVLDAELWLAADEDAAAELNGEPVMLPVLLPAEAEILAGVAQGDARALLEALAKIQRVMPAARLRGVVSGTYDA